MAKLTLRDLRVRTFCVVMFKHPGAAMRRINGTPQWVVLGGWIAGGASVHRCDPVTFEPIRGAWSIIDCDTEVLAVLEDRDGGETYEDHMEKLGKKGKHRATAD